MQKRPVDPAADILLCVNSWSSLMRCQDMFPVPLSTCVALPFAFLPFAFTHPKKAAQPAHGVASHHTFIVLGTPEKARIALGARLTAFNAFDLTM
jgi:hypothetical protein